MKQNNEGNLLRVEQGRERTSVEIKGSKADILTNWALATYTVCDRLHIPPLALAVALPNVVAEVQNGIKESATINLDAIRKAKEGQYE